MEVVAIDHDVPQVHAYTEKEGGFLWFTPAMLDHAILDVRSALHGINHGWKFGQYAVASRVDYPPAKFAYGQVDNLFACSFQTSERACFICFGEAGVSY